MHLQPENPVKLNLVGCSTPQCRAGGGEQQQCQYTPQPRQECLRLGSCAPAQQAPQAQAQQQVSSSDAPSPPAAAWHPGPQSNPHRPAAAMPTGQELLTLRMWMAGVHTASPQILSRGKCSLSSRATCGRWGEGNVTRDDATVSAFTGRAASCNIGHRCRRGSARVGGKRGGKKKTRADAMLGARAGRAAPPGGVCFEPPLWFEEF